MKGTNESMDINDWSQMELQNFVKWFIEVHHPEVVEQYQAVRAIERKAQEEERQAQYERYIHGWSDPTLPTIFPVHTQPTGTITITPPKQESIWDAMKRMAGYK